MIALFAALMCTGAYIRIPLPPVPITLQTLFTLLCAMLLPPSLAIASTSVYLFLGAIGLPVFTSGGGLAALFGPTGGYLLGLLPATIVATFIMKANKENKLFPAVIAAVVGTIAIYAVGLPYLGITRHLSVSKTLAGGLYPFIIGDTVKIIVAVIVTKAIRPTVLQLLSRKDTDEEEA